jgi:DNA-directed RNA polymerase subunit RPC12/RpoP
MEKLSCVTCGGTLSNVSRDDYYICDYCGNKYFKKADDTLNVAKVIKISNSEFALVRLKGEIDKRRHDSTMIYEQMKSIIQNRGNCKRVRNVLAQRRYGIKRVWFNTWLEPDNYLKEVQCMRADDLKGLRTNKIFDHLMKLSIDLNNCNTEYADLLHQYVYHEKIAQENFVRKYK